jgi:hypothetical protein
MNKVNGLREVKEVRFGTSFCCKGQAPRRAKNVRVVCEQRVLLSVRIVHPVQ